LQLCLWVWPSSAAREEVKRAGTKILRGELGRLVRLASRLLNGELKREKTFRRKARSQQGQEDKEIVIMSALTSCMGPMVTTLSPTLDARRCPLSMFK